MQSSSEILLDISKGFGIDVWSQLNFKKLIRRLLASLDNSLKPPSIYRRWIYDLFVHCKWVGRVERAQSRNRSSWRKCVYVQQRNWHVKHGFNAWYYFQHRIKQRRKNCEYKFIRNELGGLRESRAEAMSLTIESIFVRKRSLKNSKKAGSGQKMRLWNALSKAISI